MEFPSLVCDFVLLSSQNQLSLILPQYLELQWNCKILLIMLSPGHCSGYPKYTCGLSFYKIDSLAISQRQFGHGRDNLQVNFRIL